MVGQAGIRPVVMCSDLPGQSIVCSAVAEGVHVLESFLLLLPAAACLQVLEHPLWK
jgi:hypothetical protein